MEPGSVKSNLNGANVVACRKPLGYVPSMAKTYVSELSEGMAVESTFLCSHKALLKDKNGKPYLNLQLLDRSGLVEARVWERAPQISGHFNKLDYVAIKGNVVAFQGHLQVNVRELRTIPQEEISAEDFLPHTEKDIEQMYQDLLGLCRAEFQHPQVKTLILGILEDPELAPKFKRAPAAKSNHHAWIGGLLEHVLKLCQVGRDVLKHYPEVQPDLVLAGLILHDFGKVEELSTERTFEYTDRGQLVGHLIISVEILIQHAAKIPDFSPEVLQNLQHILLSHHGQLEYGSPKLPMTLEALMVHHLDNMDSKLQGFMDTLARETETESAWSTPGFVFKRPLYKKVWEDMGKPSPLEKDNPVLAPANPDYQPPINKPRKKPFKKAKPPHPKRERERGPLKTSLGDLLGEQLNAKKDRESSS